MGQGQGNRPQARFRPFGVYSHETGLANSVPGIWHGFNHSVTRATGSALRMRAGKKQGTQADRALDRRLSRTVRPAELPHTKPLAAMFPKTARYLTPETDL